MKIEKLILKDMLMVASLSLAFGCGKTPDIKPSKLNTPPKSKTVSPLRTHASGTAQPNTPDIRASDQELMDKNYDCKRCGRG